jgi:hypothetical protein
MEAARPIAKAADEHYTASENVLGKTVRHRPHRARHRRRVATIVSILSIAIVAISVATSPQILTARSGNSSGLRALSGGSGSPLLYSTEVAAAVAGVYSNMSSYFHAPIANWLPQSTVDGRVISMYNSLNATSTFQSLVSQYSSSNFTFTLNWQNATGISNATFGVCWVGGSSPQGQPLVSGGPDLNCDYWVGTVSTTSLTGPTAYSGLALYHGSGSNSINYAGYTLNPGCAVTANVYATLVNSYSVPPQSPINVPSGQTLNAVAAVWSGISNGYNGAPELLQTGYQIDATSPFSGLGGYWPYSMWYENYPGPSIPYFTTGGTYPGDWLFASEYYLTNWFWYWSLWATQVYDYTTGVGSAAYVWTSSGFSPSHVLSIVEAPLSANGKPEQIPEFEYSYGYWYGIACGGTHMSADSVYNAGNWNSWTLNQRSGYTNSWSYFYSTYNEDVDGWYNSYYDWNYV